MSYPCAFIPIEVPIDQNKIASIRNAIYTVNIRSPPRPQRQIQHFTTKTYELLAKLREKTPIDSMNHN